MHGSELKNCVSVTGKNDIFIFSLLNIIKRFFSSSSFLLKYFPLAFTSVEVNKDQSMSDVEKQNSKTFG